jgi:hypothetical protein
MTPEPSPEVTPEPTLEMTPEPTLEMTPEPSPEVTPEPTPEVTPEPSPEVTPEPTLEMTPEPSPEVTPEPTLEVTPEPSPVTPTATLKSECIRFDGSAWRYQWIVTVSKNGAYIVKFIDKNGDLVGGGEHPFQADTPTAFGFTGDVQELSRVQIFYAGALLAEDTGPFESCALPQLVGSLIVTKIVEWAEADIHDVIFTICIQGASHPLGNEEGACQKFNKDGGSYTWSGLLPGQYLVTEVGVDARIWEVEGSGVEVLVKPNETTVHTITNTNIEAAGSGDSPTALEPEDEPVIAMTHWVFLPNVSK